jgi:predicted kinase
MSDGLSLILTVGLPRSGKTTWALLRWHGTGSPIVSPDAIRLALHGQRFQALAEPFVWAVAKVMVRALFAAGHPTVIVDATNTTRKRRDEWRDPAWKVSFHEMDVPADECRMRARRMGDEDIIAIIDQMAAKFEPVAEDER